MTDNPITASDYTATGNTIAFTLNYAPITGASLMVINNTGLNFIQGNFTNLAQGQSVSLSYGGRSYNFIANYYGGSGNDLVLQWANTRPVGWGYNYHGFLGNNSNSDSRVPVETYVAGELTGKKVAAISSGDHTTALCTDGTLVAWGANASGQLGNGTTTNSWKPVKVDRSGVLSGKTVTTISSGHGHTVVLCSDGTVAAWGANTYGQLGNNSTVSSSVPVTVDSSGVLKGKAVVSVCAGDSHTVAVCSDGSVVAWGRNYYGGLGNGSTTDSSVPVSVYSSGVLLNKKVIAVSAGTGFTLALCSDGTVVGWGYNNPFGQLGNGSSPDTTVPVLTDASGVLAGKKVTSISAGDSHAVALCSDGAVVTWGWNENGQLGDGTTTTRRVPVAVDTTGVLAGKTVVSVSAGSYMTFALCSDGTIAAWGNDYYGYLGDGVAGGGVYRCPTPVRTKISWVPTGQKITAITAGGGYSTALSSDGTVASWGSNDQGQLGNNIYTNYNPLPTVVNVTAAYTKIASGAGHTLALLSDGRVIAWGSNSDGQLGVGGSPYYDSYSNEPLQVDTSGVLTGKTVISVAAGFYFSMGLCSDGTVASWGDGSYGKLGNNSTVDSAVPVMVDVTGLLSGKTVTAIATGMSHAVALCSDGSVVTWGANFNGQLGNNSTTSSPVPVSVDATGALAGKSVIAVAAGYEYSAVLCSDGSVVTWGDNYNGQLGNKSTTASLVPVAVDGTGVLTGKKVTAIAGGAYHILALCSDGTVAGWGQGSNAQLGNNSYINSSAPVLVDTTGALAGKTVVSIAAGALHSTATCLDGTAVTWGYNANAQLGNGDKITSSIPVRVDTTGVLAGKAVTSMSGGGNFTIALVASPLPGITSSTNASGTVGTAFNYAITSDGSPNSYGASGLPSGLSVDVNTGLISGIPSQAGVFNVLLSASDMVGVNTAILTLTISDARSSLTSFRTAMGLAADGSQDLLKPGKDDVPSLLKYAFNMIGSNSGQASSLTIPNSKTLDPAGIAGLPLSGIDQNSQLSVTYIRRKVASLPGITYTVEFTNDLSAGTWATETSSTESVTDIDSNFERVTVTDGANAVPRRFVRVRVTQP